MFREWTIIYKPLEYRAAATHFGHAATVLYVTAATAWAAVAARAAIAARAATQKQP